VGRERKVGKPPLLMLEYMDEAYSARAAYSILSGYKSSWSSISRLPLRRLAVVLRVRFDPCKRRLIRRATTAHVLLWVLLNLLVLVRWVLGTRCVGMRVRLKTLAALGGARHVLALARKRRAPTRQRPWPTRPTARRHTFMISAFASLALLFAAPEFALHLEFLASRARATRFAQLFACRTVCGPAAEDEVGRGEVTVAVSLHRPIRCGDHVRGKSSRRRCDDGFGPLERLRPVEGLS
jgi:hypothetical protein